jgi:flagellin
MTIQGMPGKVTPVATLLGTAYSLPLDAPETMLTFYPPDSSPNLVDVLRPQSRDVIQLDDNGGQLKEYRLIKSTHDTDTRLNIVEIEVQSATVITTAGESISKRTYKDIVGNTITLNNPSIVSRSGQYWIQYDTAGEQRFLPAELTILGGENEVIAQVKDATPLTLAEMPASFSTLNYAPQISKSTSNYTLTLDGSDESSNADLNLVYLGGYYYIEEKVADQYQYYYADITIKTGSNQNSIDVQADRSIKLSVTDQPYVSGSSTIYFKPENANVTVNYIDSTGAQYNDVMRPDSEKDYTFNIGQFSNAEGTYKTANIVTDQNGDLLLQTVNGTAEVILYYPMSVSVNTNVNNNSTIVTLRETGEAQRLRNPPMPLAAIDAAIARVDSKRGELGALDNRLASVIEGNVTTRNNLDAARSRIMDAEYAREVAAMTRAQILQQAGNSLLAQATQLPQGVLSLLR